MRFLNLSFSFLLAAALLAPITADAKTPKMVPVQMHNGKTVQLQLHTMKVHGQMMILVPMDMACEVFGKSINFCWIRYLDGKAVAATPRRPWFVPIQRFHSRTRLPVQKEKGHRRIEPVA